MHADPKGKRVEIDRHEAAAVLGPEIRWVATDQCQAAAESLLRQEEMDSCILVSRGQMLRFWHLTFQEYLSARALRWRTEERKTLLFEQLKLYLPEWRQTVQFLAGLLLEQSQKSVDDFIRQALETLTSNTALAERARFASVIGRALKDLETDGYFPPVEMGDRYRNELKKIVEIFEKGAAQRFDFQLRLDVAEALGKGRDPRLRGENWVRLDGGTFSMGAQSLQTSQPNYDPDARVIESPVRKVRIDRFEMGVYPVTVQEYEQFIDDAGYARNEFWNQGGFHEWTQPFGWAHQRRYLNHPVVGVSWLEAQAYCQWRKCRLPSESEWEFAARGGRDGIRYPWGSQAPNAGLAAFRGSSGRRTPVGLFPEGATPQGLQDMAGNVWEWVQDSLSDQQRVTRGGCATEEAVDLRVSSRRVYPERGRFSSLGFRVAR
jgi:formylglycine-generating enzyme required for sulfatase activity